MAPRILAAAVALIATFAAAQEAQWPPPASVEARMRELQNVLGARDSSLTQREAAREELSSLLKSPAGQARGRTADERPARPARAAIDPLPSMIRPAENPLSPAPPVAQMEVVVPPKPMVIPQSGAVTSPSGRFAVDPRTGSVLHEIPGGYVDPRTGQVTPR
jgi:hypothetical protein